MRQRRGEYLNPTAAGRIEGLDGLRAIAVVLVVVFHLWPSFLPGGFLGVDVFFVISGFLITTLLLREREKNGRVDMAGFWHRRARRLLPALVTVVSVSIAAAQLTNRDLLVDIRRQTLGAFTFSTNWLEIGAGTDYFDHTAQALLNPLWSLAVEEQFYLLWPVAFWLLGVSNLSPRRTSRLLRGVALGSAVLMALVYRAGSATRVYYGTDTHLFGLMIGASVAYAFYDASSRFARLGWQRLRLWVGFAAMAVLVVLSARLRSESAVTYRGGILAASICAAFMVAAVPGSPSRYTRLLEMRPLGWIGERSYGIYLWHWPTLLVVSELMPPEQPGAGVAARTATVTVVATAALSEFSFRYIETPIRNVGAVGALRAIGDRLRRPARRPSPGLAVAWTVGGVVAALAIFGLAAAPDRSAAQQSVEAGQRLIEEQTTPVPIAQTSTTPTSPPVAPSPDPGPAWPPELAVPPGDAITGLGDSVLSGAAPAIYREFPGIYLEAEPILRWVDAPEMVNRLEAQGILRRVVILNFGTNAGLGSEASRQALRDVLDALGPQRRVILVTVVGISYWVPETNATVARISAEYPNTAIADWHAVVAHNPGLLHSDKTHPNMDGIDAYADLIGRTAAQLGPE